MDMLTSHFSMTVAYEDVWWGGKWNDATTTQGKAGNQGADTTQDHCI